MSSGAALLSAAAATVVLAVLHLLVPALRRRVGSMAEGVVASTGGGIASAYVFVHLLPELAAGNVEIAEVLGEHVEVSELREVLMFLVAFVGFLLLYGLDHWAERAEGGNGVFAVHLGVFAGYNALITYSLPTRFRTGAAGAVLFVVAMAVHFLLTDRGLAEHYRERFTRTGRPVLVVALVVGFLLAWASAPTSTVVVSAMLALLGGFVLYNVFSDELPGDRRLRFPVFAGSATGYAAVLVAVTVVA
jgi:hypothetical protein